MGRSHITLERLEAVARMFGLMVRYVTHDDGTFSAQMGEGVGGPGWYGDDPRTGAVLTYRSGEDCWLIRGGYPIQRREVAVYLAIYDHNRTADAEQLRSLLVQTVRRLAGSSQTSVNQPAPKPEANRMGRRRESWSGRSLRFLY